MTELPYDPFLVGAREVRYDIDVVGRRFGTGFEQVAHRLTTLRRPKAEAIPFHMVRIDVAGNIWTLALPAALKRSASMGRPRPSGSSM